MINLKNFEVWVITGSQHLYGDEMLRKVEEHSHQITNFLNTSKVMPVTVKFKQVVTAPEEIYNIFLTANTDSSCVGVICWMHTFSPAKMWIQGLRVLKKPLLHLHTQFNKELPWDEIDMNFMNLNQSAHGDREFGFINSRMGIERKVVVGHWTDPEVIQRINIWSRVACGWQDLQGAKFVRFGDNMRDVAVTEGDKVEAQIKFGYSVNGFGISELVKQIKEVSDKELALLISEYNDRYNISKELRKGGENHNALIEAARIEIGLRQFLLKGDYKGFTDTFEDLNGISQLPGIAVQRLMAEGFGFGGEGDWKTAALGRAIKVMGEGLPGGSSFMEDYTYHFSEKGMVLGAHMLEIDESIADGKPECQIHPLSIGGKSDPVRLVFNVSGGRAINASIIDMGNRFRLIVNEVEVEEPVKNLPKLPVARALWTPLPDLKTAATGWILAGGAHHSVFSKAITAEFMEDFSEIAGIEYIRIGADTKIYQLKNELKWNDIYYKLSKM